MADLPLSLATAMSGKVKNVVLSKAVSGKSQTVTFDVAAELPSKYRQLTTDNLSAGFANCYTSTTVSVTVAGVSYNSTSGVASVQLTIPAGSNYNFYGKLALAVFYT